MKRQIIKIDEEKCNGCGVCVPNCHEGALQMIDGKARLISDLMCDGLGACIGHCPEGAIEIVEREAEPYNEIAVIEEMVKKGQNTVIAHLKHLKDHMEFGFLKQGVKWMQENRNAISFDVDEVISKVHNGTTESTEKQSVSCGCGEHEEEQPQQHHHAHHQHHEGGCPGSASKTFSKLQTNAPDFSGDVPSALTHWPVQMHLINPAAQHFQNSDLVLAADCVAFSFGDFHNKFLKGKTLAIACPKLDSNKEVYVEKLISLINNSKVNTITVVKMEVPCCGGILQLVNMALQSSSRKVPVKSITISVSGEILSEEWI
jgi:NAD-dependent dihydropyrimidine dehydrogenase PreA subunit